MKIFKKFLLIFIGITLSLCILELSLQTASIAIKMIKTYKINNELREKYSITILCLGESTTDKQWPPALQKILDKKSKNKKFKVIDNGKGGCTTSDILSNFENYIKGHDVDIVVSMMGINDTNNDVININSFHFKTQKLLYLLKIHLVRDLFAQDNKSEFITVADFKLNQAKNYVYNKNFDESIKILESLEDNTLNTSQLLLKYEYLINAYYISENRTNYYPIIRLYLKQGLKFNKFFHFGCNLNILIFDKNKNAIRELFHFKNDEEFEKFVYEYFDPIMSNFDKLKELELYDITSKIDDVIFKTIQKDKNEISNARKIGYNALNYFASKNYKEADKFFSLQTEILSNKSSKKTVYNYKLLAKTCNKYHIKLLAMQYPVRSVLSLKKMLEDFDEVTFISNEENFKEALKMHKIEDIFADRFAGDFGHCTKLGNTLIAANAANIILKLYDRE